VAAGAGHERVTRGASPCEPGGKAPRPAAERSSVRPNSCRSAARGRRARPPHRARRARTHVVRLRAPAPPARRPIGSGVMHRIWRAISTGSPSSSASETKLRQARQMPAPRSRSSIVARASARGWESRRAVIAPPARAPPRPHASRDSFRRLRGRELRNRHVLESRPFEQSTRRVTCPCLLWSRVDPLRHLS
jgi:hypothetical protein